MANKRVFKKNVEAKGADTLNKMEIAYHTVEGADKEAITKAMYKVLGAIGAARTNADITFDKGVKAFDSLQAYSKAKKVFYRQLFKKIVADYTKELQEASHIFNEAVPESEKIANKEAVASK